MVSDNALVRSAALCSADCVRANVQGDIGVGTVVLDAHLFVSTDPHKLRTDILPSPAENKRRPVACAQTKGRTRFGG